jgi:hypothetical protein
VARWSAVACLDGGWGRDGSEASQLFASGCTVLQPSVVPAVAASMFTPMSCSLHQNGLKHKICVQGLGGQTTCHGVRFARVCGPIIKYSIGDWG